MFLLSHVKNERKRTTGLCGAQNDICRNPRADWREQSVPVRDWKDGVFICADSCSSSAIAAAAYISTSFYRLLPMDGPSSASSELSIDALTMSNSCWGCSPSCIPTEHQKPMRRRFDLAPGLVALLVSEKTSSVDTYLEAGLDASLFMVASWPEWTGD